MPLHCLQSGVDVDLKKACFITFDDGYKDFLDYSYPILKQHKIPSTLFILPYDLSNQGHIWTSTIIFFVKHYWFSEVKDFFLTHGQTVDFQDKFDDFHVNLSITRHFCQLQQKERSVIIEDLQQKFVNDDRVIEKELLSFEELRKLDANFVSIGSHSLTHPSFKLETDNAFVDYEIRESKEIIEKELKVEVFSFAFPFAKFNDLALGFVKKYYKMCFTRINDFVDLKKIKSDKDYIYDLPRFNIHHDSAEEVFFLINGFHKKVKR